ncbi:MucR family transcriptional regulator [Methylobacterium haplocladii]|uniref:MucR family transcriptional regulator n=1 Tax=Methylobacterium haplocladii TaxID=1176176 RepID=A0A512ISD4_9HYPH|nr:MucR family transcriptional regulator [Methylobacterium haplocladii]GEP00549.1 MucR family transcriptional regulator [Methylobacterium haplocladii]GJD85462.1 Transcriptional regulatory protein ros [Methylobacterium haplocladii]GLS57849.1 MucR family transcriptional regulator [Methylobacterium haplocladii]
MTTTTITPNTATDLAVGIVSSYVAHNSLPAAELPKLLGTVFETVMQLGGAPAAPAEPETQKATASEIRKSVTPDALVSFEDGKSYKTLRRHLTLRGLSPDGYRAKWGLPADYPMTAANYSAQRSALAKSIGLGQPGARADQAAA